MFHFEVVAERADAVGLRDVKLVVLDLGKTTILSKDQSLLQLRIVVD